MNIIEAKKDKIYNKMKYLSNKYWKLDTSKRKQDNKFIEEPQTINKINNGKNKIERQFLNEGLIHVASLKISCPIEL